MNIKFICNKIKLNNSINLLKKVISIRTANNILQNINFEIINNKIFLYAVGLSNSIKYELLDIQDIEGEGNFTLNYKILSELLNYITCENIIFNKKSESNQIEINLLKYSGIYKLNTLSSSEFPKFTPLNSKILFEINFIKFTTILNKVITFASKDTNMHQLNAVLFEKKGDSFNIVASNAKQLGIYTDKFLFKDLPDFKYLISYDFISILLSLKINSDLSNCSTYIQDDYIYFEIENVLMYSKIIDHNFPDYQSIIPSNFKCHVTCSKYKFINLLLRPAKPLFILSNELPQIFLNFNKNSQKIGIHCKNEFNECFDESTQYDVLEGDLIEKDSMDISFNLEYIISIINLIDSDKFIMKINYCDEPVCFVDYSDKNYLFLLMPMSLD